LTLQLRTRFWIEATLATASTALVVLTLAWKDWIEALTGFDPDHHGGALEWAIVAVLLLLVVVIARAAHVEWRRPRAATVPAR